MDNNNTNQNNINENNAEQVASPTNIDQKAEEVKQEVQVNVEQKTNAVAAQNQSESANVQETTPAAQQTPVEIPADQNIELPKVDEQRASEQPVPAEKQKKNNLENFNSEEKVVYNIKPEKDANPIGVILFFIIMIGFVFFLPNASEYLSKYFNTSKKVSAPVTETETKEEEKEKKEETVVYHNLKETINNAKIGNLLLSNFIKSNNNNNYELTFTLINDSEEIFDFSKKYYFDFYDENSYLSSALIFSYDPLPGKESKEFTITLNSKTYERANKFTLVERQIEDYPDIELTDKEGEYKLLKCNFNNEELIYYFKDDYLETINNNYKENISNANYNTSLNTYKSLAQKYNNIEGIESNFIETPNNGFTVKTNINLKDIKAADLTNLKEYKYFIYHEKSKVVSYELSSFGYTCS